jgi:hypothetical protein
MDPVKVEIPADTWTLVASNVTTGLITIKQWQSSRYYQTYRMTGNPAPTGDHNEATSTVTNNPEINISSTEAVDVYLYCYQLNGEIVVSL